MFCTRSPSQGDGEGEAVLLSRSHLELCGLLRPDTRTANTNINTHAIILIKAAVLTDFKSQTVNDKEPFQGRRYASSESPSFWS